MTDLHALCGEGFVFLSLLQSCLQRVSHDDLVLCQVINVTLHNVLQLAGSREGGKWEKKSCKLEQVRYVHAQSADIRLMCGLHVNKRKCLYMYTCMHIYMYMYIYYMYM